MKRITKINEKNVPQSIQNNQSHFEQEFVRDAMTKVMSTWNRANEERHTMME
jgi:hypothetical protein